MVEVRAVYATLQPDQSGKDADVNETRKDLVGTILLLAAAVLFAVLLDENNPVATIVGCCCIVYLQAVILSRTLKRC